jgi:cyclohexanecarboxylate-CoA ligase
MSARASDANVRRSAMRAGGYWLDRTIDEYLVQAIARHPEKLAIVGYREGRRYGTDDSKRITYGELGDMVARAAGALRRLGVQPGDIVAAQLPNWWEFMVLAFACGRLGAVFNPMMPIFREREMSYMLAFAEVKVLVVPKVFRGFDHEAMAARLQSELPLLKHVIVVDGEGPNGFERSLLGGEARVAPPRTPADSPLKPDDLYCMMFTSGTTGSPKGVMHTSNTFVACTMSLAHRFGLGDDEVLLACSPVGHMTGFAAVVDLGIRLGGTVVLQDVWERKRGVEIMNAEGVTYTATSTPFLNDICEAVAGGLPRPPRLRSYLCAGAPIPPALIERAAKELDLAVCSLWGMTEILAGTLTEPARAHDKSATSDGRPLEGVEVKIVDIEDGAPCPPGKSGRLLVRGAQNFIGYYKRPDIPAGDDEGWFDSGDVAYTDEEGYVRISGRTKDVLIRGGENVPVFEIEGLLYEHPAVVDVAIVGYPDRRLGERACAYLVVRAGQTIDLAAVQAHMTEHKVAKQYWPERVEIVEVLPRTPSGKVQKFKLRDLARVFGDGS